MNLLDGVTADACLSPCGTYRYWLTRDWQPKVLGHVLWLMLNPSVGTATADDMTLRLCQGYARRWGYDGITVANLFALRSVTPTPLKTHPDPVGPDNDMWLRQLLADKAFPLVVAAWGVHGALRNRGLIVRRIAEEAGRPLHVLGLSKHGYPCHPLRQRLDLEPEVWAA